MFYEFSTKDEVYFNSPQNFVGGNNLPISMKDKFGNNRIDLIVKDIVLSGGFYVVSFQNLSTGTNRLVSS